MAFLLVFLLTDLSMAEQTFQRQLEKGKATYRVSFLTKRVTGTSQALKGKVVCAADCEFLLAVPVDSFDSGDSNRDLNMRSALDTTKHALAVAKGRFPRAQWEKPEFVLDANVELRGVSVPYPVHVSDHGKRAAFTLDLDKHGIERPSLFGMRIKQEVPVEFALNWKKADP